VNDACSPIYLNINEKNLILIRANEKIAVFSKSHNIPIRHAIKDEDFRELPNVMNDNHFLVHPVEEEHKKILSYNILMRNH